MSVIGALQEWYKNISKSSICTGIQIETINSLGWSVNIDLFDTIYENEDFRIVNVHKSDSNWFECIKENTVFKGSGGVENLEDILNVFYGWIQASR